MIAISLITLLYIGALCFASFVWWHGGCPKCARTTKQPRDLEVAVATGDANPNAATPGTVQQHESHHIGRTDTVDGFPSPQPPLEQTPDTMQLPRPIPAAQVNRDALARLEGYQPFNNGEGMTREQMCNSVFIQNSHVDQGGPSHTQRISPHPASLSSPSGSLYSKPEPANPFNDLNALYQSKGKGPADSPTVPTVPLQAHTPDHPREILVPPRPQILTPMHFDNISESERDEAQLREVMGYLEDPNCQNRVALQHMAQILSDNIQEHMDLNAKQDTDRVQKQAGLMGRIQTWWGP